MRPDDPRTMDDQMLEFRIQMMQDVVDERGPAAERTRPVLAEFQAVLAHRRGHVSVVPTTSEYSTEIGRRAGSPTSNQYGTFAVHRASDKQVAFLRRLIAEKDTTGLTIPATLDGISKTSASALIDRLLGKGDAPRAVVARPASEKQVAFVRKLLAEKDLTGTAYAGAWVDGVENPNTGERLYPVDHMTSTEASANIELLLALPRKPVAPVVEIAAGAYRLADGRIVRVYLGQQSGRMLAAELVDITAEDRDDAWRYLGAAGRFVDGSARRMTVDECEALVGDADHSWCCVCGRRLDDPNSVARGIGPVCRARQGG